MSNTPELLPCPFCDSQPVVKGDLNPSIKCEICDVEMRSNRFISAMWEIGLGREKQIAEASARWNRRAALQPAADTPAPVFASRHNDETGECEAVEAPPAGYQSIINRTIINRPTVTDEMIERACKAHNVGWSMWHEPQKRTARDVMRMALTAALRVSPLSPSRQRRSR